MKLFFILFTAHFLVPWASSELKAGTTRTANRAQPGEAAATSRDDDGFENANPAAENEGDPDSDNRTLAPADRSDHASTTSSDVHAPHVNQGPGRNLRNVPPPSMRPPQEVPGATAPRTLNAEPVDPSDRSAISEAGETGPRTHGRGNTPENENASGLGTRNHRDAPSQPAPDGRMTSDDEDQVTTDNSEAYSADGRQDEAGDPEPFTDDAAADSGFEGNAPENLNEGDEEHTSDVPAADEQNEFGGEDLQGEMLQDNQAFQDDADTEGNETYGFNDKTPRRYAAPGRNNSDESFSDEGPGDGALSDELETDADDDLDSQARDEEMAPLDDPNEDLGLYGDTGWEDEDLIDDPIGESGSEDATIDDRTEDVGGDDFGFDDEAFLEDDASAGALESEETDTWEIDDEPLDRPTDTPRASKEGSSERSAQPSTEVPEE